MTKLRLLDFDHQHTKAFRDINSAWIEEMFSMEAKDRDILNQPQEYVIDPGGAILMVEAEGFGIIGTCALMKVDDGIFELTKMGVLAPQRGLKAGDFLLAGALEKARNMGAHCLYLLTSHKCQAAIHLYEKAGFMHDADIMKSYGNSYARCDVAMQFPMTDMQRKA